MLGLILTTTTAFLPSNFYAGQHPESLHRILHSGNPFEASFIVSVYITFVSTHVEGRSCLNTYLCLVIISIFRTPKSDTVCMNISFGNSSCKWRR